MKRLMILSGMLLLMLLMSACGPGSQASSGESPLPLGEDSAPVTLTSAEQAKIDPDLLKVIEWEEAHPGEGQEFAPDDFVFDGSGWIQCVVRLDPNKIVITSSTSLSPGPSADEQPAGQLIIHHGGWVKSIREIGSSVSCFMPLNRIKELAQEEVVVEIIPNQIRPWKSYPVPPVTPTP